MKPPVGSFPPPVDPLDAATQTYVNELGYLGDSDFILAKMSGIQSDIGSGVAIDFDTADSSRGLAVNSSGRFSGLKAGRTYLLQAGAYISHTAEGFLTFQWYDVTGATNIGTTATIQTETWTGHHGTMPIATAMIVPTVDTEVEVRTLSRTAGVDVGQDYCFAQIIEVSSKKVIAGEWIPVETKEVTGSAIENFEFDYDIDGNRDEAYKVEFFIKRTTATTRDFRIRVNNLISSTNVAAASLQADGAETTFTDIVLARTIRDYMHGYFIFNCAENPMGSAVAHIRTLHGEYVTADDPATAAGTVDNSWSACWTDSGNLTRMVIQNTQQSQDTGVSEIDVGTVMRLYRKAKPSDYAQNKFPAGHLDGLVLSKVDDANYQASIGSCKDSTGQYDMETSGTLNFSPAAAVGIGGLDQGTEAANTMYAILLVDGPTVAPGLIGVAAANYPDFVVLPAGYTHYRRLGWVKNNASSNLAKIYSRGSGRTREFWYDDLGTDSPAVLANGEQATDTAVDCSSVAPPTAVALLFQYGYLNNSTNARYFTMKISGGTAEMFTYRPGTVSTTLRNGATPFLPCDASQQVEYRVSTSSPGAHQLSLWVHAWVDEL